MSDAKTLDSLPLLVDLPITRDLLAAYCPGLSTQSRHFQRFDRRPKSISATHFGFDADYLVHRHTSDQPEISRISVTDSCCHQKQPAMIDVLVSPPLGLAAPTF